MPLRVLVVDDNLLTRAMLSDMLGFLGHKAVAEAGSAPEALQAYKDHSPDLVLLDISLEEGDGLSVLKDIRGLDPKARVLMITANSQKNIRDEAIQQGAQGFLNKPLGLQEFTEAIAKFQNS